VCSSDLSIDVIVILLALKCKYPDRVFLLRGNHEFPHINHMYGFYDEIMQNYNSEALWVEFQVTFELLPLAAVVGATIFCVHGGLSPNLSSLEQIAAIPMPIGDYVDNPLISDLIWSDPEDTVQTFAENHRGSGVLFGPAAVKAFLGSTDLKLIIRAHQCIRDGYSTFADSCGVTLFSCSDYCNVERNRCGVAYLSAKGKIELNSYGGDWRMSRPRATMAIGKELGMRRVFPKNAGMGKGGTRPVTSRFNSRTTPITFPQKQKIGKTRTQKVSISLLQSDET
jgi:diadenosine tetraphosphatase ApaH/serine/threonine PP2A family protein phosphatase